MVRQAFQPDLSGCMEIDGKTNVIADTVCLGNRMRSTKRGFGAEYVPENLRACQCTFGGEEGEKRKKLTIHSSQASNRWIEAQQAQRAAHKTLTQGLIRQESSIYACATAAYFTYFTYCQEASPRLLIQGVSELYRSRLRRPAFVIRISIPSSGPSS